MTNYSVGDFLEYIPTPEEKEKYSIVKHICYGEVSSVDYKNGHVTVETWPREADGTSEVNPYYITFPIASLHDLNKASGFKVPPRLQEHYKRQKDAQDKQSVNFLEKARLDPLLHGPTKTVEAFNLLREKLHEISKLPEEGLPNSVSTLEDSVNLVPEMTSVTEKKESPSILPPITRERNKSYIAVEEDEKEEVDKEEDIAKDIEEDEGSDTGDPKKERDTNTIPIAVEEDEKEEVDKEEDEEKDIEEDEDSDTGDPKKLRDTNTIPIAVEEDVKDEVDKEEDGEKDIEEDEEGKKTDVKKDAKKEAKKNHPRKRRRQDLDLSEAATQGCRRSLRAPKPRGINMVHKYDSGSNYKGFQYQPVDCLNEDQSIALFGRSKPTKTQARKHGIKYYLRHGWEPQRFRIKLYSSSDDDEDDKQDSDGSLETNDTGSITKLGDELTFDETFDPDAESASAIEGSSSDPELESEFSEDSSASPDISLRNITKVVAKQKRALMKGSSKKSSIEKKLHKKSLNSMSIPSKKSNSSKNPATKRKVINTLSDSSKDFKTKRTKNWLSVTNSNSESESEGSEKNTTMNRHAKKLKSRKSVSFSVEGEKSKSSQIFSSSETDSEFMGKENTSSEKRFKKSKSSDNETEVANKESSSRSAKRISNKKHSTEDKGSAKYNKKGKKLDTDTIVQSKKVVRPQKEVDNNQDHPSRTSDKTSKKLGSLKNKSNDLKVASRSQVSESMGSSSGSEKEDTKQSIKDKGSSKQEKKTKKLDKNTGTQSKRNAKAKSKQAVDKDTNQANTDTTSPSKSNTSELSDALEKAKKLLKDKQSESDISEDENSESEKENTIAKQSTNKKVTKEQPSKAGSAETEREKNLMIPVDTPLTSKSSKPTMNIHSSSGQMFTRSPLISSLAGPARMLNTSQLQGEEMQRILETYLENIEPYEKICEEEALTSMYVSVSEDGVSKGVFHLGAGCERGPMMVDTDYTTIKLIWGGVVLTVSDKESQIMENGIDMDLAKGAQWSLSVLGKGALVTFSCAAPDDTFIESD